MFSWLISRLLCFLFVSTVCNGLNVNRATAAVSDCLTAAQVPQLVAGSTDYALTVKPFNLRLAYTPAAVVQPTTVQQVQDAVACAVKAGLAVSPKSGGHSYASHGIGGEDGHLVVDMKLFTNVTVDQTTGIASVGSGSRLGNVATALYAQGQRGLSHGTCPGVGVGGHVTGGGYGYSSRTQGLAMDALVEATVVLANSTVVTASSTVNPDLFWALRGAGSGSFGIITQYKFQTFVAPASVVVYNYGLSVGSAADAAKIHAAAQTFAASTSMPQQLNMRLYVGSYGISLEGLYWGNTTAFQAAIQPFFTLIGQTPYGSVQSQTWIQALTTYAYASLTTPLTYDSHETFYSKSLMTSNLTTTALTAFWNYWSTTAKSTGRDWYLIIDLHGGPNSAISQVDDAATAYAHRSAQLKYEFYDRVDSGTYPAGGQSFLTGWVASIQNAMPTTRFGMYMNYADAELNATKAHDAYYLDHYPRLTQIKAAVDPTQVFRNPQAVMLT